MTQLHVIYLLILLIVLLVPLAFVMGRDWERNFTVRATGESKHDYDPLTPAGLDTPFDCPPISLRGRNGEASD